MLYPFLIESVTENSRSHLVPLFTDPLVTANTEKSRENEGDPEMKSCFYSWIVRRERGRKGKKEGEKERGREEKRVREVNIYKIIKIIENINI